MIAEKKKETTVFQRVKGFAACHILFSLTSLMCVLYPLLPNGSEVGFFILVISMMLIYFPLGVLKAWLSNWTEPQTQQKKALAVLLPAIVAWVWVGIVLVTIMGEMEELFMVVFAISFLFAVPSSLFVVMLFIFLPHATLTTGLGFCGLMAGFLPPLLFALGSFWQAKRQAAGKERVLDGRDHYQTDPGSGAGGQAPESI